MEGVILFFACKYFGDWERIYDALDSQEDVDLEAIEKLEEEYKGKYLTIINPEYPERLKHIDRPPFILFIKGKKDLLKKNKKIWYFGSFFDEEHTNPLIKQKKEMDKNNIIMVSGFTNNFEKSMLNVLNPTNSIIIRDAGINSYINMSKLEEEHFIKNNLILSEYPGKVIPSLETWKRSNKVKIGLTNGIFLLNSLKEKITFETIANTIDLKRDVFCYNKHINNKSHNSILISKGAIPVKNIKEIFSNEE